VFRHIKQWIAGGSRPMMAQSAMLDAVDSVELPPRHPRELGVEPGPILSGRMTMGAGPPTLRTRGSDTWLLFYTLAGRGFHRSLDGNAIATLPGDVSLFTPHAMQEYGAPLGKTWESHWVHFVARAGWARWLKLPTVRGIPGLARTRIEQPVFRKRIHRLFDELHRDLRLGGLWRTERGFNTLERILLAIGESCATALGRSIDSRIESAMELMANRPADSYTVSALARQARLSPSRFAHLFRQETGHSVIEALLNLRLQEAAKLLQTSSLTVSEIAYSQGFHSLYYFSRQFKRRFGLSPGVWRKKPIRRS
jgi:AraC family transcriptional regulator of arabinose operon